MIEVIRENGNIIATCDWWLVDAQGNFDIKGKYVWLNQIEISDSHKNNGVLGIARQFYKNIVAKAPTASYAYFKRERKKNNKVKIYSKRQWSRLLRGGRDESIKKMAS